MAYISILFAGLFLVTAVYNLFLRKRGTVKSLRGPLKPSILLGHQRELRYQAQVGDLEFAWVREYGPTCRIGGCWGADVVFTADPKALQYIMHTAGYHFPKRADLIQSTANLVGWGILSVEGQAHQRHRKVMNPSFTAQQLRAFLPLFQRSANRLTQKWKDQIQTGTKVFNISRWLARLTLDAIGDAAFDFRFGALDDDKNPLSKSFENLFSDSVLYPPAIDLLFKALWVYIPRPILALSTYIPTKEYRRFRNFRNLSQSIARDLIEEKANSEMAQSASRDVMSVLVRSNQSEDAKRQLTEEEVLAQMATLMLAGHETTASTTTWLLYELCRHPEHQKKIREEIQAMRDRPGGNDDFTINDMDSMEFTNACIKEVLRLHPIVPTLVRCSDRDDVIPLATPVTNTKGETISEVVIPKGQEILISIAAYNRLPSVWGDDADEWNPYRFLDASGKERQTSIGVFANLLTFAAGLRACIGWRFALIELQAILVELIEQFEFDFPDKNLEILRVPAGIMIPMIKGKMHEGTQMPLHVSVVE